MRKKITGHLDYESAYRDFSRHVYMPELMRAVSEVGAFNVSQLSRMTNRPKETIRYALRTLNRKKKYFVDLQPRLDLPAMGLDTVFIKTFEHEPAMNESYPQLNRYLMKRWQHECGYWYKYAVPDFGALEKEFKETIEGAKNNKGRSFKIFRGLEKERGYSEPDSYDWNILAGIYKKPIGQNFTEMARELGVNDITLRWHVAHHILPPSGYVSGFETKLRPLAGGIGTMLFVDMPHKTRQKFLESIAPLNYVNLAHPVGDRILVNLESFPHDTVQDANSFKAKVYSSNGTTAEHELLMEKKEYVLSPG